MKIGLVLNPEDRGGQLTPLGVTQAGFLIQLALAWFGLKGLALRNGVWVFTSHKPEDLESATLARSAAALDHDGLWLDWLPSLWGHYSDANESGGSKAGELAEAIKASGKSCFLVCGFFSLDYNVGPFLQAWGIPIPLEWPDVNQAALVRIDTEAKTIEFDRAPFPARER